jgi:phospholipase/carboxylesterase
VRNADPGPTGGTGTDRLDHVHRYEPGASDETLLVLHGTGGDENDLVPLARSLAPRANLLAPRGRVLENGKPRFFRRLGMGVFDEPDLIRRVGEMGRFVRAASERYGFDLARLRALGYSNGANMAAAMLLLDGGALAGGVLLRAVLPLEPERLPDLAGKQVFIAAGRLDPYAPAERVEALEDRLARAGGAVELRWANAGHELDPSELDAAAAWLARTGAS